MGVKWKLENEFFAVSECGNYRVVKNYDDLYTPWRKTSDGWEHIDGRGCDTAKEAAEVCVRHSERRAAA